MKTLLILALLTAPQQNDEVSVADNATQPQGAVDGDGGIYVVFIRNGDVEVSGSTDKGKNLKVAQPLCECCAPGPAVDGKGNPILAFREGGKKSSREIFLVASTNGGKSLSSNVKSRAVSGEGDAGYPNLACGARMGVLVYESRGGVRFKRLSSEK